MTGDEKTSDELLTKGQKRTLESAKKKGHTAERARFWGCKIRTMQLMIADRVPVDSSADLVKWFSMLTPQAQKAIAPDFRKRIAEERALIEGKPIGGAAPTDAYLVEFNREYKPDEEDQGNLANIKRECAWYLFRMRRARDERDIVTERDCANQFRAFSDVVHDCEIRAFRLGRDMGDLVPRTELETPARFLAYHLLRCADAALNNFAGVLTKLNPDGKPLTFAQIVAAGEPVFLTAVILDPMTRAMQGDNGAAPPAWLVAAMKAGLEEAIET